VNILEVKVGEPLENSLTNFGTALQSAMDGQPVAPYCGIGFETMSQFGRSLRPALGTGRSAEIGGAAQHLCARWAFELPLPQRSRDVTALMEWMVTKGRRGPVFVPLDEMTCVAALRQAA
jgi:hypothetical protein